MADVELSSYPVTIRGQLTEPISRWLFLIKWLLIIPHLAILAPLYIGLVVSWLLCIFAILFSGVYPRSLFEFNVGVLRWTWRVGFYSYQALGTDKYPPFSLAKDDNYPADLDVVYPQQLNQGLVLVKWWLLALPHYIVLNFLQGGIGRAPFGLLSFLVVVTAVINLFTGRYHKDTWELIVGINQWGYRVAGYALLLTDRYPPFRLGK